MYANPKFQRRHYRALARVLHESFMVAQHDPDQWRAWSNYAYDPIVAMLAADNPRFNMTEFSYAVATGKGC